MLEVPAGAVAQPTELTITPLAEAELAPLDAGPPNVTADAAGYRFRPAGLTFQRPVRVTLWTCPYLVDAGFT